MMIMTEYAFPAQLLEELHAHWRSQQSSVSSTLPDDPALLRLLETCYHASLRTAELRATRCVLAYISTDTLAKKSLLRFEHPAILTASELVRLAPVTELHRTLIGCHHFDGTLKIWGLFEHGHAWLGETVDSISSTPVREEDLPHDCLTITIEAPGAISVARGGREVVRLREGKIIAPHEHPLRQKNEPLGSFFETLVDGLRESVPGGGKSNKFKDEWERLLDTYMKAIASILERIRSERHGGSIVISASPLNETLAYRTYTVIGHASLADDILSHCWALWSLQEASKTPIDHSSGVARYRAETAVRQTSHRLIQGVSRISLLAAIDGAVLLDGKLRIEGFGVRFPVLLPPGTTVLDALTGIEYPCDEWGLRHQSVFSVCQQCEEAVGFIVSQDGSVKAVKSVKGRLHFWDGILD